MVDVNELTEYLNEWRSSRDIKTKFNLSNTEFYHIMNWLKKGHFITKCKGIGMNEKSSKIGFSGELKNKQNVTWLYKNS